RPSRPYLLAEPDEGTGLSVDIGTATTRAMVSGPNGQVQALLFDGSPVLPSAVYADASGKILTGRDALEAARRQPHQCDPYPKLRLDDGSARLGSREVAVVELIAALLRRVGDEARRVTGTVPGRLTMTHPPSWHANPVDVIDRAAQAAG